MALVEKQCKVLVKKIFPGWLNDRQIGHCFSWRQWLMVYVDNLHRHRPFHLFHFPLGKKVVRFFLCPSCCVKLDEVFCDRTKNAKSSLNFKECSRVGKWITKHPSSALLWSLCSSLQLFLLWWSWVLFITVIRWQWTGRLGYYCGMKMHLVLAHHQIAPPIFHISCSWQSIISCYIQAWRKAPIESRTCVIWSHSTM